VFRNIKERKKSFVKPRKPFLDCVEYDLKKMNIKGWRNITRTRDSLKMFGNVAKVLRGFYSQWIKEK
jgi:hypothetical protein